MRQKSCCLPLQVRGVWARNRRAQGRTTGRTASSSQSELEESRGYARVEACGKEHAHAVARMQAKAFHESSQGVLGALDGLVLASSEAELADNLRRKFNQWKPRFECMVAWDGNGRPIGAAEVSVQEDRSIARELAADAGEYAYIAGVCVDASARQLGIGRVLLDQAGEVARSWGFPFAALHVHLSNQGAREFFRSCGFEEVSQDPSTGLPSLCLLVEGRRPCALLKRPL